MKKTFAILSILLLAGCVVGEAERPYDDEEIGVPCLNGGGRLLRCAALVTGDCEGSPYTQWWSLAPADGEWHLPPQECGSHEGSWLEAERNGGRVIIHRNTTVTKTDRTEDWLVQLVYDGELCFERYAITYVDPDEGCPANALSSFTD